MKPGIITQARMGSTRLPGKVMKKIKGKTLLEYHIERASRTGLPVIVATTDLDRDAPIVALCDELEVPYYRGSESDVLSRYVEAADKYDIDPVIRITSDCPLIDPELILKGLKRFQRESLDYLFVDNPRTYPHGVDFRIVLLNHLRVANEKTVKQHDREHVVPYINRQKALKNKRMAAGEDYSHVRITVDYDRDFKLIKTLIAEHGCHKKNWREIVNVFEERPQLLTINAEVTN